MIGSMPFKVTGCARDGRFNHLIDEWNVVRMPPMFFASEAAAVKNLDDYEQGILWRRNEENDPYYGRNTYSVLLTLNCNWPEGARGSVACGEEIKPYNKKESPVDEALAKQNQ